ncbi:hypothetical protein EXIGLDRAFT_245414 [Exidia glandulosa HHB12029]|uniref:ZZ-type domain-containing protein n=1 Tax=Exidia glandulosa HHB12029 TaxID=1314781 RepID=A0A166BQX3_EXIGL|nr:hypothetical protein EXIGLDRAFT_245414 [Exidia glandulosa HHB12029]
MALVDHKHTRGHSFLILPTAGNFVVVKDQAMSAFCAGCRTGISGKKYWSCLSCPGQLNYCTPCFTQNKEKAHIAQCPSHLFINTVRWGFYCDGCQKDVSDLPWMKCTTCAGDDVYGLCSGCYPRWMELHPQHRFESTFGCDFYNVPPGRPAPPPTGGGPAMQPPYSPTSPLHPASPAGPPVPPHPSHSYSHPGPETNGPPRPNVPHHAQTYPAPAPPPAPYYPRGITCGMCRRFTVGEWWVCNLCPDNTVCHTCIRPAHAYHGHSFSLVRG